jgi:hypothetical protein
MVGSDCILSKIIKDLRAMMELSHFLVKNFSLSLSLSLCSLAGGREVGERHGRGRS